MALYVKLQCPKCGWVQYMSREMWEFCSKPNRHPATCGSGKCPSHTNMQLAESIPDGIDFGDDGRTLLRYLANEDAKEYINSALDAYILCVHEFGSDISVRFTMNYHDMMDPHLEVRLVDGGDVPEDVIEKIMFTEDKINTTLRELYGHRAKVVRVSLR